MLLTKINEIIIKLELKFSNKLHYILEKLGIRVYFLISQKLFVKLVSLFTNNLMNYSDQSSRFLRRKKVNITELFKFWFKKK